MCFLIMIQQQQDKNQGNTQDPKIQKRRVRMIALVLFCVVKSTVIWKLDQISDEVFLVSYDLKGDGNCQFLAVSISLMNRKIESCILSSKQRFRWQNAFGTFNPIRNGSFWAAQGVCVCVGRGGAKRSPSLKPVTHVLQWWNLAQLYLT